MIYRTSNYDHCREADIETERLGLLSPPVM